MSKRQLSMERLRRLIAPFGEHSHDVDFRLVLVDLRELERLNGEFEVLVLVEIPRNPIKRLTRWFLGV